MQDIQWVDFMLDTIDARISGSMCRVVSRDLRFYCKPKMRQLFVIALRAVRYCSPNEGKKENAKEGNCILGLPSSSKAAAAAIVINSHSRALEEKWPSYFFLSLVLWTRWPAIRASFPSADRD